MQTNLRFLREALAKWSPEVVGSERIFSFSGYRIVTCQEDLYSHEQELIIAPVQLLADVGQPLTAPGYILLRKPGESLPKGDECRTPMLVLTSDLDIQKMGEEIRKALLLPYEHESLKSDLLDALAGGEDLGRILCLASRYLGNPFTVFDSNFALLAHSIPDGLEIPEARQVVEHKSANLSVLVELRDSGELGQIQNDASHAKLTNLPNGYQKLTCVLSVNHHHMGLLCFYNYQRPFRNGDAYIVEYISKIVCAYLQRRNWTHMDNWNPYEYFIDQLLRNDYDDLLVEQFRERLGLTFPTEMFILLGSASWYERQQKNVPLTLIAQKFRELFPGSCVNILDDSVLCICAAKKWSPKSEPELWEGLRNFLGENRLFVGVSDAFSRLSSLRTYYEQAECAMIIGAVYSPNTAVYSYRDFTLYHMLRTLSSQCDITHFCHPAVAVLEAYDKEYRTEYLECLRTYLECNGSIAECAKHYYMHYNSIKYRLKVIQSVCEIDFNDPDTFVQLYLSFKIRDIIGKLEETEERSPLNFELLDSLD